MKSIISYIKEYLRQSNKLIFITITLLTAALVFINYYWGLDSLIRKNPFVIKLTSWYTVFAVAFFVPWFITGRLRKDNYLHRLRFLLLLLLAPLLFAIKLTLDIDFWFTDNDGWNHYWNHVAYWPLLAVIIIVLLVITWKIFQPDEPFYGIKSKGVDWKPYLFMLLIMLPLVALAATQKDFLLVYPKIHSLQNMPDAQKLSWWYKLLYELSYGTDFITIELFFRGFLVLAFAKWAGKDAILPMACFYCSIHFGKPLGECISSYFGGIILGIVVYNTRSVWGGLLVHVGIAWLMEFAGYLGNSFN